MPRTVPRALLNEVLHVHLHWNLTFACSLEMLDDVREHWEVERDEQVATDTRTRKNARAHASTQRARPYPQPVECTTQRALHRGRCGLHP
jgi:hypothetical protein